MMVLRLLKIPKSTYFDWVHYTESQRQREDTILKALLREIWQNNYKAYGAPRLRALILKNLLTLKVKINLDGDSLHLFLIYSKIGCEA